MKCKVVINRDSGNCNRLDLQWLRQAFGQDAQWEIIGSDTHWNADGFDTVVVCGGDGTLHHALEICQNKRIVYLPCGTLNETAHTESTIRTVGNVNGKTYGYVCAAGSFTEIGYRTENRRKKRWKSLAYLPQVLSTYRCHEMAARLNLDGKIMQGNYTLLMVLKSHRCFGFAFNPHYKKTGKNYLVAVKSCGRDCLKNRIKMFWPFLRIFFGKTKPSEHKNWLLLPFDNLEICLEKPQDFCFDGEKRRLQGNLHFSLQTLDCPIKVVQPRLCRGKNKGSFSRKTAPVSN